MNALTRRACEEGHGLLILGCAPGEVRRRCGAASLQAHPICVRFLPLRVAVLARRPSFGGNRFTIWDRVPSATLSLTLCLRRLFPLMPFRAVRAIVPVEFLRH